MKASELREKLVPELRSMLATNLRENFRLRLAKSGGEFNQTHQIKIVRHNIARIETILVEKQGKE